jgi:hypothetical protein
VSAYYAPQPPPPPPPSPPPPPVSEGRSTRPPRRPWRRAGSIAVGLALVGGAIVVHVTTPDDYEDRFAPLAKTGRVEQVVDAGEYQVKVDNVQVTPALAGAGQTIKADGIFVVVTMSARTEREIRVLRDATLRTPDRREYVETDKWILGTMSVWNIQPELWRQGQYLFDIPREDLTGAVFQVSDRPEKDRESGPWEFPPVGYELTAQADIDLGIDAARARRLLSDAPDAITPLIGTTS